MVILVTLRYIVQPKEHRVISEYLSASTIYEAWKHTNNGMANDYFFPVDLVDDGGYVAVGYSDSFGEPPDDDLYVVRLDLDEPHVAAMVASAVCFVKLTAGKETLTHKPILLR